MSAADYYREALERLAERVLSEASQLRLPLPSWIGQDTVGVDHAEWRQTRACAFEEVIAALRVILANAPTAQEDKG